MPIRRRSCRSAALKGADAGVASVLVRAAAEADCDLHLALVSIEESGSAEHTGYYGRRRRWSRDEEEDEDEDGFEVAEVFDRPLILSEWRRPDGGEAGFGDFPFHRGRTVPARRFRGSDAGRAAFSRGDGQRRRVLRAHLSPRRLRIVAVCAKARSAESGRPRHDAAVSRRSHGALGDEQHIDRRRHCGVKPTSFRGTCCAPGHARRGGRTMTPKLAGCSICKSGWATWGASIHFSPSCRPKAITPRPTMERSFAPSPFFRPRVQRSYWSGSSGVTLRPISAPAAICCRAASRRRRGRWATWSRSAQP